MEEYKPLTVKIPKNDFVFNNKIYGDLNDH